MMKDSLELTKILTQVASYAHSPEAKATVLNMQASSNLSTVTQLLDETTEMVQLLKRDLHLPFVSSDSALPVLNKASKGIILSPAELEKIADYIRTVELLKRFFARESGVAPILNSYAEELVLLKPLQEQIYDQVERGQVADSADRDLFRLRKKSVELTQAVKEELARILQSKTIATYLQESRIIERGGYYTLAVKASFKNLVPGTIIDQSANGKTVYLQPAKVDRLLSEKAQVDGQISAIEMQILGELTNQVDEQSDALTNNISIINSLDVILAKAKYSLSLNGLRAQVSSAGRLELHALCHPLIPNAVPLDLSLQEGIRGLMITGPNAGGKTVVLKTVGLAILMTELGLFLKSKAVCTVPLADHVYTEIGDNQDLDNSLSTFSAQMTDMAEIVTHAQARSVVLVDEIGSGTDPNEGSALAIGILQALQLKGALILATTHYSQIKDFALQHPAFETASMDFNAETLVPTYKLLIGQVGDSRALWIAKRVGMPTQILTTAEHFLADGIYPTAVTGIHLQEKGLKQSKQTIFHKGDVVFAKALNKEGIFYELEPDHNYAKVFIDKQFNVVSVKRLELRRQARDLYPENYNYDLLFISDWQEYKFNKDLDRGSKKAFKKLKHKK